MSVMTEEEAISQAKALTDAIEVAQANIDEWGLERGRLWRYLNRDCRVSLRHLAADFDRNIKMIQAGIARADEADGT